jgi:Tol biopolymer transport system component
MFELGVQTQKGFWFPTVSGKGTIVNSAAEEWDPFIAADESYLLFESDRAVGFGGTDIYVTFNRDGSWSQPVNLGPNINTKDYEVAARVSPDGRYIFFEWPQKNEQDISSDVIKNLKSKNP